MIAAFILGTRPEIIKLSPIMEACEEQGVDYFVIHSGQHFSESMDAVFFEELRIKAPFYNIHVNEIMKTGLRNPSRGGKKIFLSDGKRSNHGKQTGLILGEIEDILLDNKVDIVFVQGDTNTTLAGALAAVKLDIKVAHVEAGLRSYDPKMPEEVNRILVDRISEYLFCPTEIQRDILLSEGISGEKIFVMGNTIVDAIHSCLPKLSEHRDVLKRFDVYEKEFFLLTLHRQENVDDRGKMSEILRGMEMVSKKYSFPVLFPVHPRTYNRLMTLQGQLPRGIILIEPLGYYDFLVLEKSAKLVFTDSGGVQEEACILGVRCLTLRDNTERPETINAGANVLTGANANNILMFTNEVYGVKGDWVNPFGDGDAGKRIVSVVVDKMKGV